MNTPARSILALLVCLAPGCSAAGDGDTFGYDPNGNASGSGSGGGPGLVDSGGSNAGGSNGGDTSGCSEAAKLVYLVDSANQFIKLEPATMTFTTLGILSCPTASTPNSMAVDRNGIAWVNYSGGEIFHVDIVSLNCTSTTFIPNQQGFGTFGMGFVSDSPGSNEETLYITDDGPFGMLDTDTLTVTTLGSTMQQSEFTGTGLAELWSFTVPGQYSSNGLVQKLNKTNGSKLESFPLDLPPPTSMFGTAWAFAFWGGRYYLFYQGASDTTDVYIFDPNSGKAGFNRNLAGTRIVGAGVSTCAPTEVPL